MILILIPIIILGVLAYKHICPGGVLKVDYDFCREDPFISELSPMGRVLEIKNAEIENENYCYQEMVIDPVYFDVRLPQSFRGAELKVWFQSKPGVALKIGPRFRPKSWQWDLEEIDHQDKEGDWTVGTAKFDLRPVEMENHRIRFLISSPGLDESGEKIIFKKIEIEFKKEPLNWGKIYGKIKELNIVYKY